MVTVVLSSGIHYRHAGILYIGGADYGRESEEML